MNAEELHRAWVIAKAFHETYERLAPTYGYQTRKETSVSWEEVPDNNQQLMVGVVADLLDRGVIYDRS